MSHKRPVERAVAADPAAQRQQHLAEELSLSSDQPQLTPNDMFHTTYDSAGNVTNDGVHSYTYDSENRIVAVDGGTTASYEYDHSNRRYKKNVGSTVTHYIWEGFHVLAEHDGSSGAVLTGYVFHGSRMVAKTAGGDTQFLLSDRLSVRLMLDASGNIIGRQGHLPLGEDFGENGTQDKHHFTSYERDGESGSDYAVNRQYVTNIGRFMSVDPKAGSIKNPQSLDRYTYVGNDPINKIDPDGKDGFIISGGHIFLINCHQNVKWVGEWDDGEWDVDPSNGETCEFVDLGSVSQDPSGRPVKRPCPSNVKKWLDKYLNFFSNMAGMLGVPAEFIIALATAESGWRLNYRRNNPFNSPPRERYRSLESARDHWIDRWANDVQDVKSIDEFANNLWNDGYDPGNRNWVPGILTQYNFVLEMMKACKDQ